MDVAYPEVPVELMNCFHEMDRELYSILVFQHERDPKVSVNVIALWIWLEQNKITKHAVHKIVSLSSIKLINGLADEAVACLRCIITSTDTMYLFSSDAISEISLTQSVLGKQLSLKFFHENGANALCGIRMVVETVCVKVLDDLIKMAIKRNAERPPSVAVPMIPRRVGVTGESSWSVVPPMTTSRFRGPRVIGESSRLVVPPMTTSGFGGLRVTGESSRSVVPPMDRPMTTSRFGGLRVTGEPSQVRMKEPEDKRKMFATFSKGYPVSEGELWGYLIRKYGEYSVESISMQVVKPNVQPLFAMIVFTTSAIVDLVLRGGDLEIAKFKIKGKRVWMRKFIPKA